MNQLTNEQRALKQLITLNCSKTLDTFYFLKTL